MPEKAFLTGKGPNGALISQERGILGSPLPRLSETHPTFCGHYFLDTQNRLSHNSPVKKQCLINQSIQFNINQLNILIMSYQ